MTTLTLPQIVENEHNTAELRWMNRLDRDVTPASVRNRDGSISTQFECVRPDGTATIDSIAVRMRIYKEARDALGY